MKKHGILKAVACLALLILLAGCQEAPAVISGTEPESPAIETTDAATTTSTEPSIPESSDAVTEQTTEAIPAETAPEPTGPAQDATEANEPSSAPSDPKPSENPKPTEPKPTEPPASTEPAAPTAPTEPPAPPAPTEPPTEPPTESPTQPPAEAWDTEACIRQVCADMNAYITSIGLVADPTCESWVAPDWTHWDGSSEAWLRADLKCAIDDYKANGYQYLYVTYEASPSGGFNVYVKYWGLGSGRG